MTNVSSNDFSAKDHMNEYSGKIRSKYVKLKNEKEQLFSILEGE